MLHYSSDKLPCNREAGHSFISLAIRQQRPPPRAPPLASPRLLRRFYYFKSHVPPVSSVLPPFPPNLALAGLCLERALCLTVSPRACSFLFVLRFLCPLCLEVSRLNALFHWPWLVRFQFTGLCFRNAHPPLEKAFLRPPGDISLSLFYCSIIHDIYLFIIYIFSSFFLLFFILRTSS